MRNVLILLACSLLSFGCQEAIDRQASLEQTSDLSHTSILVELGYSNFYKQSTPGYFYADKYNKIYEIRFVGDKIYKIATVEK